MTFPRHTVNVFFSLWENFGKILARPFLWGVIFTILLIFLAHLSRRLKWAIVIAHRPSSVHPSSVVCKLSHFRLLLWNRWTESTKLDRKQDLNALYQVCVFQANQKNKMAALASDWLRHFQLLLSNRWTEFNETWQEARSQRPIPSLCFLGRSEK